MRINAKINLKLNWGMCAPLLAVLLISASCSSVKSESEYRERHKIETEFIHALKSQAATQEGLIKNLEGIFIQIQGAPNTKGVLRPNKYLTWHANFYQNGTSYNLLVFDCNCIHKFPGWQPVTIVLTTEKYSVLSWLEDDSRESIFDGANLHQDKEKTTLFIKYDIRRDRSPYLTAGYLITDNGIGKVSEDWGPPWKR